MYHGDIALGNTIDIKFTTRQASGAPTTLAGSPVISAYVGNGTTEITAGITLTVDFDSRTGLNNVRVVATSGNGFATATDVELVITTGTVNSVSVVGEVIGSFSIENRSGLRPATAGRTLVVDAAGLADANMVKAGPTGSGTAQTAGDIYSKVSGLTFTVSNQVDVNVKSLLGTAWLTPGTAGTPDVNVKLWNALTTVALPLVPTVAGRTLDVSAGGEAGVDWANVGTPGSTVNLSATTVGVVTLVNTLTTYTGNTVQTGDSFARLTGTGAVTFASLTVSGATTFTGAITATNNGNSIAVAGLPLSGAASMGQDYASVGRLNADLHGKVIGDDPNLNAISITGVGAWVRTDTGSAFGTPAGASVSADIAAVKTDTGNLITRIPAALFSGITSLAKWLGIVAGKTADAGTLAEVNATTAGASFVNTTDSLEAIRDRGDAAWGPGSVPTVQQIVNGVLDEANSAHLTAGTIGKNISTAGGAADPLLNTVPGSYASGTAGNALGRIGSGQIVVTSPVLLSGSVTIKQGDAYLAVDGRALDWTNTGTAWPDLTGATIKIHILAGIGGSEITNSPFTGSVITATAPGQKVRFAPTAAQTAAMPLGGLPFSVVATLSDLSVVTLLTGTFSVQSP